MFYDGGECVRELASHSGGVQRPRGYSCEELGGAAYFADRDWSSPTRLSRLHPLFVSPHGTGSSRYLDVVCHDDVWYATWQQSQPDHSQPLVMNQMTRTEIETLLSE